MRPRTTVLDVFSTFIQFAEDRFQRWQADPHLVRSMERCLTKPPPSTNGTLELSQQEGGWVRYWHQVWQQSSGPSSQRAAMHLNAYLQEACYWAAETISRRFATTSGTLADNFQVAIAHLERVLKGYRPDYGSRLKAYGRNAFGNIIRDYLRQRQDVNICSDWGLLRRLSQAQLQRSLLAAGISDIDIEGGLLLWQCFKVSCPPDPHRSVRGISAPDAAELTPAVERYNQLRTQLSPVPTPLNAQQVLTQLTGFAKHARAYLTPTVTSLNQSLAGETGREQLDRISAADDTIPMVQLLVAEAAAERQQYQKQLETILETAIAALDPPSQKLLQLYYQQTLTQKEIADQLAIKQYQVSRQLSRLRQQLLLAVAQWSQETLHISMESTVLAHVSEVIHEWLQRHYRPEPRGEVQ